MSGPRLRATFVAVAVLLCQAAAWVHTAANPHVTCLEHGESVHLAPGGQHARDARDAGPALTGAPIPSVAHAHEHCNLQSQGSATAPAPAPTPIPAIFARATEPQAPRAQQAAALLRFAPKTSPPLAPAV